MNTKIWLSGSALLLGVAGFIASFLPHEILDVLGLSPVGAMPLLIQLLGATLLAFAIANWIARGSAMGGIYNRSLAVGNLTHFTIGAMALTRAAVAGRDDSLLTIAALIYLLLAVGSAMILFSKGARPGPMQSTRPN